MFADLFHGMQMPIDQINGMRINEQLDNAIQVERLEALTVGLLNLAVLYQVLHHRNTIRFESGQRMTTTLNCCHLLLFLVLLSIEH